MRPPVARSVTTVSSYFTGENVPNEGTATSVIEVALSFTTEVKASSIDATLRESSPSWVARLVMSDFCSIGFYDYYIVELG